MTNAQRWTRARDSAIAILAWLTIIYVVLLALGHVRTALLLLILGTLLAYVLSPLVKLLSRALPRWLAIAVVYVIAMALLATLGYVVVSTAVSQLIALTHALPSLLAPNDPQHPSPAFQALYQVGLTDAQIEAGRQQFIAWAQGAAGQVAGKAVPIVTGVAGALLDLVLTIVISIYLVIDGPRLLRWLRTATPVSQRQRVRFVVDLLHRTVGGYVRGELILAALVGVLVGVGMYFFGLPYALLLGALAFVLEFIPILGVFISGATCVLLALTKGWPVALGVLAYFVIVHVIEGDIVGPRVIGRVLGLHPVLAIVALIAGGELFGLWGALFAAPVAGVIQAVVVTIWTEWRESHPEEFPQADAPSQEKTVAASPIE